jgi:hypothetical protein
MSVRKRPIVAMSRDNLAGIQYAGEPGSSKECRDAVIRLLQYGDQIRIATIITCQAVHCLLLEINDGDLVAVKSGFASGYRGEGPREFSYVLEVLHAHGVTLQERNITEDFLDRVNKSCLTKSDLTQLRSSRPVHGWSRYVDERHMEQADRGTLWTDFPAIIPWAIVDSRIIDLAKSFWENPDEKLLTAYRRLEDILRKRSGIDEHGARLISLAFLAKPTKLYWPNTDPGEQQARANLFLGAFGAFRNPRAHRESKDYADEQLSEFLVTNQLFRLEHRAKRRRISVRKQN